jgi:hypothetical protein
VEASILDRDEEEVIPEDYRPGVRFFTTKVRLFCLVPDISHSCRVIGMEVVLGTDVRNFLISWGEGSTDKPPLFVPPFIRHHNEQFACNLMKGTFQRDGIVVGDGFQPITHSFRPAIIQYSFAAGRHTIQVNDGDPFTAPLGNKGQRASTTPYFTLTGGTFCIKKITLSEDAT